VELVRNRIDHGAALGLYERLHLRQPPRFAGKQHGLAGTARGPARNGRGLRIVLSGTHVDSWSSMTFTQDSDGRGSEIQEAAELLNDARSNNHPCPCRSCWYYQADGVTPRDSRTDGCAKSGSALRRGLTPMSPREQTYCVPEQVAKRSPLPNVP